MPTLQSNNSNNSNNSPYSSFLIHTKIDDKYNFNQNQNQNQNNNSLKEDPEKYIEVIDRWDKNKFKSKKYDDVNGKTSPHAVRKMNDDYIGCIKAENESD